MKRKRYERNRKFVQNCTITVNKPKRKNNMIDITKEKFDEYVTVQKSGMFNMFDPKAREMTTLSKEEWVTIMQEYKSFN